MQKSKTDTLCSELDGSHNAGFVLFSCCKEVLLGFKTRGDEDPSPEGSARYQCDRQEAADAARKGGGNGAMHLRRVCSLTSTVHVAYQVLNKAVLIIPLGSIPKFPRPREKI